MSFWEACFSREDLPGDGLCAREGSGRSRPGAFGRVHTGPGAGGPGGGGRASGAAGQKTVPASFEGVVAAFGLPGKGEIDPTTIMSACYIFLFGLNAFGRGLRLYRVRGLPGGTAEIPQDAGGYAQIPADVHVLRHLHHVLGRHVRQLLRRRGGRGVPGPSSGIR